MTIPALIAILGSFLQAQDTLLATANNSPVWGDSLVLVEEVRIGELEGEEVYQFGYVSAIAPAPDGSVYVGDGQIPLIRHYGPDGEWIRDVGRSGEGPGEYLDLTAMRVRADGTLVVYDARQHRIIEYDAGGSHVRSIRVDKAVAGSDGFEVRENRGFLIRTLKGDRLIETAGGIPSVFSVLSEEGEEEYQLDVPPEDPATASYVLSGRGGYFRPFTVMTLHSVSPKGYVVSARNDEYAIDRELPDGRIVRITRDEPVVPVLPEEKEIWEQWNDLFESRPTVTEPFPDILDEKPYFRYLFVDKDGRFWAARYWTAVYRPYTPEQRAERGDRPHFEWRQPLVWDVLDPRGAFLGRVTLPFSTSWSSASGDHVWGIQAGDLREDYVVRWRVTRSDGSPIR